MSSQELSTIVSSLDLRQLSNLEKLVRHRIEKLTPHMVENQHDDEYEEMTHKNLAWIKFWRNDVDFHGYRTIQNLWNGCIRTYCQKNKQQIDAYVDDMILDLCMPKYMSLKKHQLITEMTQSLFFIDEHRYGLLHSCYYPLNKILSEHYREFRPDLYEKFEAQYVPPQQ